MAHVHLIEGPVGAGKSTYAIALAHDLKASMFNLDEWMVTLFQPDRPDNDLWPWYAERKTRCIEQIWRQSIRLLKQERDVVLELGLVSRAARQPFYERVQQAGYRLTVHLLETSEDIRRQRVRQRNTEQGETYSMDVSDEVFELASQSWEALDDDEIQANSVIKVDGDGPRRA